MVSNSHPWHIFQHDCCERQSRGTWRAWCAKTCMPGSEGGGWKRAQMSNALTVYPTPARVCPKVKANPHQSQLSRSVEEDWKRGRNVILFQEEDDMLLSMASTHQG